MRFAKYKMSSLNEALLGNCNIDSPEEVGFTAAVDPTYAKAVTDRKAREEKFEKDFEESDKLHKEFVADNQKREVKTEETKEMKAMKLAEDVKVESPAVAEEEIEVKSTETSTESLTESVDFGNPLEMGRGACTPLAPNYTRQIRDYVKHYGENADEDRFIVKSLKRFLQALFDAKDTAAAFNDYWTNRYPAMLKYIDDQIDLIPADILDGNINEAVTDMDDDIEGLEEFLDINATLDASGQSVGLLGGTGGKVLNASLEENDEETSSFTTLDKLADDVKDIVSKFKWGKEYEYVVDNHDHKTRLKKDGCVFDNKYTKTRLTKDGNISLRLKFNLSRLQNFTDEQDSLMDDKLQELVRVLESEGYTLKNAPKVSEQFFLISNGWGNVYRYVTLRVVPKTSVNENIEDDPHFFPAEEVLTEAPVATAAPKTRTRGENEVKYQRDYSSEDLWLAVYDELSSEVDNEGSGQQVDKQIKARRGERYENVYPHGDSDIIIYATNPEEFEFAKKVAQHYGVTCREPVEDTNPATNGHYKWSMVIEIPEDELFDAAFKPLHRDDEV